MPMLPPTTKEKESDRKAVGVYACRQSGLEVIDHDRRLRLRGDGCPQHHRQHGKLQTFHHCLQSLSGGGRSSRVPTGLRKYLSMGRGPEGWNPMRNKQFSGQFGCDGLFCGRRWLTGPLVARRLSNIATAGAATEQSVCQRPVMKDSRNGHDQSSAAHDSLPPARTAAASSGQVRTIPTGPFPFSKENREAYYANQNVDVPGGRVRHPDRHRHRHQLERVQFIPGHNLY